MSKQLYKVLDKNRRPIHGGTGQWLPEGEWMPRIEGLVPCERGYHVCRREHLVFWLAPAIWEVQTRGEHLDDKDKQVWSEARLVKCLKTWNERTQRLFACDCAARVLPLFEREYPDDKRPRRAIEVARLFAEGRATEEELDAAQAAAWAAALAAAWAAAWHSTLHPASNAAWAAAQAAAWDASRAAAADAREAAGVAEHAWQTTRLFWYLEEAQQ